MYVPEKRPRLEHGLNPLSADNAILQTAVAVRDVNTNQPTIFVTMDVNLRIRADAFGLPTEAYEHNAVDVERMHSGIVEIILSKEEIDKFIDSGSMSTPGGETLTGNTCVVMHDESQPKPHVALARFHANSGELKHCKDAERRSNGDPTAQSRTELCPGSIAR